MRLIDGCGSGWVVRLLAELTIQRVAAANHPRLVCEFKQRFLPMNDQFADRPISHNWLCPFVLSAVLGKEIELQHARLCVNRGGESWWPRVPENDGCVLTHLPRWVQRLGVTVFE